MKRSESFEHTSRSSEVDLEIDMIIITRVALLKVLTMIDIKMIAWSIVTIFLVYIVRLIFLSCLRIFFAEVFVFFDVLIPGSTEPI